VRETKASKGVAYVRFILPQHAVLAMAQVHTPLCILLRHIYLAVVGGASAQSHHPLLVETPLCIYDVSYREGVVCLLKGGRLDLSGAAIQTLTS
jgi:hypothetical protein